MLAAVSDTWKDSTHQFTDLRDGPAPWPAPAIVVEKSECYGLFGKVLATKVRGTR